MYAHATVTPVPNGKVCLWIGAKVLLEYSYEEAIALLTSQRDGAQAKLAQYAEDGAYLSSQKITTEVLMARVFNHDVKARRVQREVGGAVGVQG